MSAAVTVFRWAVMILLLESQPPSKGGGAANLGLVHFELARSESSQLGILLPEIGFERHPHCLPHSISRLP
jgi:hypothetical protein